MYRVQSGLSWVKVNGHGSKWTIHESFISKTIFCMTVQSRWLKSALNSPNQIDHNHFNVFWKQLSSSIIRVTRDFRRFQTVFSSLALTNLLATWSEYRSANIRRMVFEKVLNTFDLYNKTRSRILGIDLNFESLRR